MLENSLINIKDIKEGDEIIISCHGKLKYLKVLNTPQLSKKTGYNNEILYKNVKCSSGGKIKENVITYPGTNNRFIQKYKDIEFETDSLKHGIIYYQDLNFRDIYLVKRKI